MYKFFVMLADVVSVLDEWWETLDVTLQLWWQVKQFELDVGHFVWSLCARVC